MASLLTICTQLHKSAQVLTHKCHLPPIARENHHDGETPQKIQQRTSQRLEVTEATTKVTIKLMEQHLVQPSKVHTMIQAFMATLEKDMKTLTNNSTSHEAALKEFYIA
jgi:hypothetical protein